MYHKKLHVQMFFLMMNTWCSKHVEDIKNWIKTLIWKACLLLVTLHNCRRVHRTMPQTLKISLSNMVFVKKLIKSQTFHHFGWQQAVPCLPLFQFPLSCSPYVLVQCIELIRRFSSYLKNMLEMPLLQLRHTHKI